MLLTFLCLLDSGHDDLRHGLLSLGFLLLSLLPSDGFSSVLLFLFGVVEMEGANAALLLGALFSFL